MNADLVEQLRRQAEETAGREINCYGEARSEGSRKWHECSCGWKSPDSCDDAEYPRWLWVEHIQKEGAEIIYPEGRATQREGEARAA